MWQMWLLWLIFAYLCGSVPFGLLMGKAKGVDVRHAGSGNVGATNVGRVLGRPWGFLCFGLDVFKGLLPVLSGGLVLGLAGKSQLESIDAWRWLALSLAAMLGHIFPVWLWFRGGKGVATGLGVMLGMWPWLTVPAVGALAIWLVMVKLFGYIGLASVVAALALPMLVFSVSLMSDRGIATVVPFMIVTSAMAMLVVLRHRSNLMRMWAGTEPKDANRGKAH